MKRNLLVSVALLGGAWAGNASAVIVGGIDFGVIGESSHLETTTIAETFIGGDNQTLSGYGQINTVNGTGNYCAVDADCKLFFYFTDYLSTGFSGTEVFFTGGTVNVYYDPVGDTRNLLNFSSPDNVTYIQGLTEWVQLEGHDDGMGYTLDADGTLTGANISFTGSGLLDVVFNSFGLASVQSFLDGNSIADGAGGFADMILTTSGNDRILNAEDLAACDYTEGSWCIQGSADLRGDTVLLVSEPGPLALLALGMIGIGFASRRRSIA